MKESSLDPRNVPPPLDDDDNDADDVGPDPFSLELPAAATSCQENVPEVFPLEMLDRAKSLEQKDKAKQVSSEWTNESEATLDHESNNDTAVLFENHGNLELFNSAGPPECVIERHGDESHRVQQESHRRPGAEYVLPDSSRTTSPAHHIDRRADLPGERDDESAHLVSASLVVSVPTVEAEPVPYSKSRKYQWIGGIAIVLVISVITIVVAVITSRSNDDNAKVGPTLTPTAVTADMILMEILNPVLPESSKDAIQEISSPQYFAFQWLLSNHLDGYSDIRIRQRYALATIYYATNGLGWYNSTGWLEDADECNWDFSTYYSCESYLDNQGRCNLLPHKNASVCQDGVLTILRLDNNLVGTLPLDISILSNLTYLSLGNAGLVGSFPAAIGMMTNLKFLELETADFTGSIPSLIGQLTNLEYLSLSNNQLTGSIPLSLGQLTNLVVFTLSFNIFPGPIPSFINQLTNLVYLDFSFAVITGSVPTTLGLLTNLVELNLMGNTVTGSIPSSIRLLKNLVYLSLASNALTGSIPSFIGQLTNLESLWLYGNALNGTIPFTIGQLTNLENLDLDSNPLTGTLPSSISNLTKLRSLLVANTTLEGSILTSYSKLTSLEILHLSDTALTGSIPSEVCDLSNLTTIMLNCSKVTCACNNSCLCD